jgi:hypothetical protein
VATKPRRTSAQFRYLADPVCIASLLIYVVNRFYLKPHHIGGLFTVGYLNDVLCLPLFMPMILRAQHMLGLRRHDDYPRLWEILQHWVIFSILFEVIIPRFPMQFDSTADPWDVVAYLAGGLAAWVWWRWQAGPYFPDSNLSSNYDKTLRKHRRAFPYRLHPSRGAGPEDRRAVARIAEGHGISTNRTQER